MGRLTRMGSQVVFGVVFVALLVVLAGAALATWLDALAEMLKASTRKGHGR